MDPNHLNGGLKRGLTVRLVLQMENLALEFLHYTGLLGFFVTRMSQGNPKNRALDIFLLQFYLVKWE